MMPETKENKDKAAIIFFSGDLDKALAGMIIALGAAAKGMDVKLFFTFWGLNIIRKDKLFVGKSLVQRLFGLFNRGGSKHLKLSKFNFGGVGKGMIKGLMKKHNIRDVPEMIKTLKQLGATFQACDTSMVLMGLKKEDFIDEVSEIADVSDFLDNATKSKIHLFI